MKRFFSIIAVAATMVAACVISSCNKTTSNLLVGEWVNETVVTTQSGQKTRTIVYTFNEPDGVAWQCCYDGEVSGGNGGTYTFNNPNVSMSYTVPVRTETGVLNGNELTVENYEFGSIKLTKKQ